MKITTFATKEFSISGIYCRLSKTHMYGHHLFEFYYYERWEKTILTNPMIYDYIDDDEQPKRMKEARKYLHRLMVEHIEEIENDRLAEEFMLNKKGGENA